jgi:exonuclease 3'-5' domain-containing protein 1
LLERSKKFPKDILQDNPILKVFFDVCNDPDAWFAQSGVALQSIEYVQLMQSASRKTTGSRRFLNGLRKCFESKLRSDKLVSSGLVKQRGERLF